MCVHALNRTHINWGIQLKSDGSRTLSHCFSCILWGWLKKDKGLGPCIPMRKKEMVVLSFIKFERGKVNKNFGVTMASLSHICTQIHFDFVQDQS